MARPKKEIDGAKVKKLAGMGLTVEEIAAVMECDKRTLERRFAAVIKEGREHLTSSLKRKQFVVAMRGNVGMLIWLGKQYLRQRERVEHAAAPEERRQLVIPDADDRFEPAPPG